MDKAEEALHGWVLETGQQLRYIPEEIQWTIENFFKSYAHFPQGNMDKYYIHKMKIRWYIKEIIKKILKDSLVLTVLLWK